MGLWSRGEQSDDTECCTVEGSSADGCGDGVVRALLMPSRFCVLKAFLRACPVALNITGGSDTKQAGGENEEGCDDEELTGVADSTS